jgi:hypothetical protein
VRKATWRQVMHLLRFIYHASGEKQAALAELST